MGLALLYSGGKDSSLAALLLAGHYDVTLVTGRFGVRPVDEHASEAARALGLSVEPIGLDRAVAAAAVERMVADGFPKHGIQQVHEHALETVAAGNWNTVADGTRRDDRVPTVDRSLARSLEDRFDVDYVAPLAGFGRSAIDDLAARTLRVDAGPSEEIQKGDYETEVRAIMAAEYGEETVEAVFPEHTQSRVVGRR